MARRWHPGQNLPPLHVCGQVVLHVPTSGLHRGLSGEQLSLPRGLPLHVIYLVICGLVINVLMSILAVVISAGFLSDLIKDACYIFGLFIWLFLHGCTGNFITKIMYRYNILIRIQC